MSTRKARPGVMLANIGVCLFVLCVGTGCAAGVLVALTLATGAVAVSGEPERLYGTQGRDFDEQRVSLIQSGVHTPADVANILGNPQTKVFTGTGEEWSYRYYVPATALRSGFEKILTVHFQEGKVDDLRYKISAL